MPSRWHQCWVLLSGTFEASIFSDFSDLAWSSAWESSVLCLLRSQPTFAFPHQVGSHRSVLHSQGWAVAAGGPIPLGTDTNTPLLSVQHTKASGIQRFPCCDLGINSHTQYFGTMPHFWAQYVKMEIFTWGVSAVGRKFCSTFVFKVLKIKYGQYITRFLMEAVTGGLRSKMELDASESETRVEMDLHWQATIWQKTVF